MKAQIVESLLPMRETWMKAPALAQLQLLQGFGEWMNRKLGILSPKVKTTLDLRKKKSGFLCLFACF